MKIEPKKFYTLKRYNHEYQIFTHHKVTKNNLLDSRFRTCWLIHDFEKQTDYIVREDYLQQRLQCKRGGGKRHKIK